MQVPLHLSSNTVLASPVIQVRPLRHLTTQEIEGSILTGDEETVLADLLSSCTPLRHLHLRQLGSNERLALVAVLTRVLILSTLEKFKLTIFEQKVCEGLP